ncbi:hypothetical protein GCM10022297_13280 [Lactobacillus hamsteri]
MLKSKETENKQYIANTIATTIKLILENNPNMTFEEATNSFLNSKTYLKGLALEPELYYHEGRDYFYDLWNNEQKYGKPIPSVWLELHGLL